MGRILGQLFFSFLRLFFHLLYHQFAWSYDLVAWVVSVGMWKEWVLTVLPEVKGERVLELGHGPGHLQRELLKKGIVAVGLDESKWMGKQAKRRLEKEGLNPQLVRGLAQALPFPKGTFDQVVATFPSEYISESKTLEEIRRALKLGGELIVLPVAWTQGSKLIYRAAAWLFRVTGQAPSLHSGQPDDWSDSFLKQFKRAGFEVEMTRVRLRRSEVVLIKARRID